VVGVWLQAAQCLGAYTPSLHHNGGAGVLHRPANHSQRLPAAGSRRVTYLNLVTILWGNGTLGMAHGGG
jgi:hypothetical protein